MKTIKMLLAGCLLIANAGTLAAQDPEYRGEVGNDANSKAAQTIGQKNQKSKSPCASQSEEFVSTHLTYFRVIRGSAIVCLDKAGGVIGASYTSFPFGRARRKVSDSDWLFIFSKELRATNHAIVDVSGKGKDYLVVQLENGMVTSNSIARGHSLEYNSAYEEIDRVKLELNAKDSFQKTEEALKPGLKQAEEAADKEVKKKF